jgi:hypothetical protein
MLKEYDAIKICSLREPNRSYDGTEGIMREPRVGDTGTVVDVLGEHSKGMMYVVECVNPEGNTVWLADFWESELDKIGADTLTETEATETYDPAEPGLPVYVVGLLLGSIVTFAVTTLWLDLVSWPAALIIGGLMALLGVFTISNIGEAIFFTLFLNLSLILIYIFVISGHPRLTTILGVVATFGCGLSVGKLVVGVWQEKA